MATSVIATQGVPDSSVELVGSTELPCITSSQDSSGSKNRQSHSQLHMCPCSAALPLAVSSAPQFSSHACRGKSRVHKQKIQEHCTLISSMRKSERHVAEQKGRICLLLSAYCSMHVSPAFKPKFGETNCLDRCTPTGSSWSLLRCR